MIFKGIFRQSISDSLSRACFKAALSFSQSFPGQALCESLSFEDFLRDNVGIFKNNSWIASAGVAQWIECGPEN